MAPAPAAPIYRITPLTPAPDRNRHWRENDPIEVDRSQVFLVVKGLKRCGVRKVRLQPVTDELELLDLLAEQNLPCLMRRQVA
jgi:hypothetical protein